jgi:hypothetical protein
MGIIPYPAADFNKYITHMHIFSFIELLAPPGLRASDEMTARPERAVVASKA